jgi:hypothetical protein
MQHFSSSSIQMCTKTELWDVGLVTFRYFQQYLSHRRDGSLFLKIYTWSTTFLRALRHSSTRMLEIIHKSWNSATFRRANRLMGLPSGHQCLHIQSNMCTTYKYNQMLGDGLTVHQAYKTGPSLSKHTSQQITGWFLLQSEPSYGHLVTFYYRHSTSGLRALVKFLLTDAGFLR